MGNRRILREIKEAIIRLYEADALPLAAISRATFYRICYLAWDWWCCSTGQWTPRTTLYFSLFGCRLPQTFHSAPTWLVSWRFALSASNESLCVTSLHYDTSGACSCWSIIEKDQENCIWKKWSNSSRLCSSNGSVHSRTTRISNRIDSNKEQFCFTFRWPIMW